MALKNGMRQVHPGAVLKADFRKPTGFSVNALAKALRVAGRTSARKIERDVAPT